MGVLCEFLGDLCTGMTGKYRTTPARDPKQCLFKYICKLRLEAGGLEAGKLGACRLGGWEAGKLEAGGWRLEAGGLEAWRPGGLEAGELEAGGWRLESGGWGAGGITQHY